MMEREKEMRLQMGGGRSRMSRHVSQNADVAVVTGGQRQSGGRQSRDPASGPGGGCHKPSFLPQMGGMEKKGKEGRKMKLIASYVYVEKVQLSSGFSLFYSAEEAK